MKSDIKSNREYKSVHPRPLSRLTGKDRRDLIAQLDCGSSISDSSLDRLAESCVALDLPARRLIYRTGDQADSLFAIVSGRIKLCRLTPDSDREAVIDILSPSAVFGESVLYSTAGVRNNCAISLERSRLLKIPAGDFLTSVSENGALQKYTIRLIGQRRENAERRLADLTLNGFRARLEGLLAEFSMRYGVIQDHGVLIDIELSHREIASILGATRETVSARLNALRREGTIDFVNRRILVKRPASLKVS